LLPHHEQQDLALVGRETHECALHDRSAVDPFVN
jgi:hypothetical protein